jgi:hypothetical protein
MRRLASLVCVVAVASACSTTAWMPAEIERPGPGIHACYRASALGRAGLPTRLTFGVLVGLTGKATEVGIVALEPGNTQFERCVLQHLLDQQYGYRYAGLCYVTTVRLEGARAKYSTAKIGERWCKKPYILPPARTP